MTYFDAPRNLRQRDLVWRLALLAVIGGVLAALRVFDPEANSWFPLRTSCGAISGLPCLFCGTTRAMHHLLHGEFGRAIYFNWLAVPILVAAVMIALIVATEAAFGRRVLQNHLSFPLNSRRVGAIAGAVVVLWAIQITLAITLQKHELLNPAGPLYSLFVR